MRRISAPAAVAIMIALTSLTSGFADLTLLLSSWGQCAEPCPPCVGDLDRDCAVGFTDLTALLGAWGPCDE